MPLDDVSAITFLGERLASEHPIVKSWMVGSPADVPFDSMSRTKGKYRLAGGLKRESFYPVFEGYKDTGAVGMRFNVSDPLQFNRASVVATYSPFGDLPQSERIHLKAEYARYDWHGFAELNAGDFYDLFGPTKTGRKGSTFEVGKQQSLIFDLPRRVDLDVSVRAGVRPRSSAGIPERGRRRQPAVHGGRQAHRSGLSQLARPCGRRDRTAMDDRRGGQSGQRNLRPDFPGHIRSQFVPSRPGIRRSGLAPPPGFRRVASTIRSPTSTSAHSATTGWIIATKSGIARYTVFPAPSLNEISGRTFVKSMLEWNVRADSIHVASANRDSMPHGRDPPCSSARLAPTSTHPLARRVLTDVGGQIDFRFGLLSTLEMTVSVGAATAFENGFAARHEAMLSVKILK